MLTSRRFVEPFTRLKNRANLFRRKNYSSQTDISNPRSSLPADHLIPTHQLPPSPASVEESTVVLKRSNSMICPQQRLQTFLKGNRQQRNSICVQLTDCSIDESSTDEYHSFNKSSSSRYWTKKMSNINEQDVFPSDESLHDKQEKASSSSSKISACTMTGKSLNNLDECLSSTSSEDKGVQTTFDQSIGTNCSTSLSSSSTSIQTDSLEHKSKTDPLYKHFSRKEPVTHEEQPCIYWVNYLGSIAIPFCQDQASTIPINAIHRLKQSTQFARVLPIIGLSISSRGVEFLKHTKDRVVICFHAIQSIHCACQDQDLRYFAYVTREQHVTTSIPSSSSTLSIFPKEDSRHYCHVFVVKNQSMSTEVDLLFLSVFEYVYLLILDFVEFWSSIRTSLSSSSSFECCRSNIFEKIEENPFIIMFVVVFRRTTSFRLTFPTHKYMYLQMLFRINFARH